MPLKRCRKNNKPGYQWGDSGACYTYAPGDKASEKAAKEKAFKQGIAIHGPEEAARIQKRSKSTHAENFMEDLFEALPVDVAIGYISKKERDKIPAEDFAWPEEKKFPIRNQDDLDAAVKLIGRAPTDKQDSIRRNIIKIAKRKGLELPDSWK